jgi:hypothetical protein
MNSSQQGSSMKSLKIDPEASAMHPSQLASYDSRESKSSRNTPLHSLSGKFRIEQTEKKKRLSKAFPAKSQRRDEEQVDGETFYKLVDLDDSEEIGKTSRPFQKVTTPMNLAEQGKVSLIEAHRLDVLEQPQSPPVIKSLMATNQGPRNEQPLFAKLADQPEVIASDQRRSNTVIPLTKQTDNLPKETTPPDLTEAQRRWSLLRDHCDSIRAGWQ